jgi:hypothetical protein
MTGYIEHRKRVYLSGLRTAGSITVAGLYLLSPALWSSVAWSQQSRMELAQAQTQPRTTRPRANPIVQPTPSQPSPPTLPPVALPVTDPNSALGSALASCDKGIEASEPFLSPVREATLSWTVATEGVIIWFAALMHSGQRQAPFLKIPGGLSMRDIPTSAMWKVFVV